VEDEEADEEDVEKVAEEREVVATVSSKSSWLTTSNKDPLKLVLHLNPSSTNLVPKASGYRPQYSTLVNQT
jgi:hypothetical protein